MAVGDRRVRDISHTPLETADNGGRERLAWAFLLGSFVVWLILILATPFVIGNYLQNARRPLLLAVEANEGTVGLEDVTGRRPAVLAGDAPQMVEGEASISTRITDSALVTVYTPDEEQILGRFKVSNNTSVDVLEATAPRFEMSEEQYEVALELVDGILRLTLPPRDGRPLVMRVSVPQGGDVVLRDAGQYTVDAGNGETWVTVLEGEAATRAGGEELMLQANQGAVLAEERPPAGPLSSERDLVKNGDFSRGLAGWDTLVGEVERADQPAPTTGVAEMDGESVLRIQRVGIGHADATVRQPINQDVVDFESLELHVTMRILAQSLGVCGVQGSECPLFVRIIYEDVYGVEQTWQQGFYAKGNVAPDETPDVCKYCGGPVNAHQRIAMSRLHSYESGNLVERLAQQNIRPRVIKSIELEASGHSFETHVFDVGLVAAE